MLRKYFNKGGHIFQMLLDGVMIGFISGGFSILYRYLISSMNRYRDIFYSSTKPTTMLTFILILVGIVFLIDALLKWAPLSGGSGIPQIRGEILGVFHMEEIPTFLSKIIGGSLGNLAGFSLGREGPSIQIGGAMAKLLARVLKRDNDHMKFMITAGTSAGLAAAFNAPIAGTVFAMEEVHRSFSRLVWIPCIIASVIANYLSFQILGHNMAFSFAVKQNLPMGLIPLALVVGLLTGIIGVLFNRGILRAQGFFAGLKISPLLQIGGLMILTFFIGKYFYRLTGGGHHLLEELALKEEPLKILVFLLIGKLIFTCICFGSGVQGGIFLPVLVLGGLSGALVYQMSFSYFNVEGFYINFIILGMAGILTSVVRAPLLSILLVTEMAGTFTHLIGITVSAVTAYYVADLLKNPPIYESLFDQLCKKFIVDEEVEESDDYVIYEYDITIGSPFLKAPLSDMEFPGHGIVVSVERQGKKFIPKGKDVLKVGDRIIILAHESTFYLLDDYLKNH